ncbi:hypothetical protein [Streptomyces europaeiscabiei]
MRSSTVAAMLTVTVAAAISRLVWRPETNPVRPATGAPKAATARAPPS